MESEDASFSQRVFHIVAAIPYGKVTTYGEVARLAGSPRAARQVAAYCVAYRKAAACPGIG
jgi:methylated-DNA-protein-cysteine methyltransferase related protein